MNLKFKQIFKNEVAQKEFEENGICDLKIDNLKLIEDNAECIYGKCNNNNFHYEDCISKITHIAVGILKDYVSNEN